jgi:hypothetical protein
MCAGRVINDAACTEIGDVNDIKIAVQFLCVSIQSGPNIFQCIFMIHLDVMMIKTGLSQLTKHKEIIGHQDLQLINAYLNNNPKNPVLLRLRFWFNLAIHFVSRGLKPL